MQIRLASYNIQYGIGKDLRCDLRRIADELRDADIICLQEVEVGNPRNGLIDQPAELARILSHEHHAYGAGVDIYLGEGVPGGYPGLRRKFGNMILSRWPMLSIVNHTLPKMAVHGTSHLQRTAMEAVIATPSGPLRLCCAHLDHASPATRMPQAEMLRHIMLCASRRGPPWAGVVGNPAGFGAPEVPWPRGGILMGDMNFAPEDAEYSYLLGDISPMTGKRISPSDGLFDAWTATGHEENEGATFMRPDRPQARLDHCLLTADYLPTLVDMAIDADAQGSDHQPIFVTLRLSGEET